MNTLCRCLVVPLVSIVAVSQLWAGNGIQVTGFGAQSSLMGGADVAYASSTTNINANPATLTRYQDRAADFYSSTFYIENRHRDALGNDATSEMDMGTVFGASYISPASREGLIYGFGVFVQGGVGFDYQNLETNAGPPDDLAAEFMLVKFAPSLAWEINPHWSAGINLGINYASIDASILPDTSRYDASLSDPASLPVLLSNPYALTLGAPQSPFFGMRLKHISATNLNVIAGIQWRPDDHWYVGLAYTSETDLGLQNGSLTLDMSSAGLGRVNFSDVDMEDLSMPQNLALGVAYDTGRWLLAAEYTWIDYSSAFDTTKLVASHSNSDSIDSLTIAFPLRLHDQHVYSAGIQYRVSPRMRAIAGVNYSRQPIPEKNMLPLLDIITEGHIAAGISYDWSKKYRLDFGVELQIPQSMEYDNPSLPIGVGAQADTRMIFFHLMLGRRW